MKNIIYYFSGTGNSLKVAKDIANLLGETELISIAKAINDIEAQSEYERVGFVFPVYFYGVPNIVKDFIGKLSFSKSQYIFSVITYGGNYCKTFSDLDSFLIPCGGKLSAGFAIRMPENYIVMYNTESDRIQKKCFDNEAEQVKKISDSIQKKMSIKPPAGFIVGIPFKGVANRMLAKTNGMAANFHVTDKCNGCGTCARICPVGNITIEKTPEWGQKCQMCVACLQWCPQEAIEYADKTKNRKRYHNPDIKISDMF